MGDREAERELTRRDLMALGGLAAPVGALVVARAFRSDTTQTPTDDYGEAIGPRRLNAEPADIIAEFANERPGTLMAYCQLFWPIYRQASKIDELERLCIGYLGSANDDDPYRIRALP